MADPTDNLRDKDQIVLQTISNGQNDIQKITEATTLKNHEVNYCFTKLENLNLITIKKPDGYTTRNINGQKRVFQHPKQAELTKKAEQYLEKTEQEDLDEYKNLSHGEIIERITELENQVAEMEKTFKIFKNQVIQKIN